MSRLKQLGKDSLVYGVGVILARGIGFFLLPVYTRIFTPEDYGAIEMLSVVASLLSAVLVMGMDSAQSFYFYEQKKNGKEGQIKLITAILQWKIIWGSVIVLIATILSPFINSIFFNGKLSWEYFFIAFSGALFAQILNQSAEVYRLLYRPWPYILIILGQSLISASLIVALVILFDQGILGYFLGSNIASLLMAILGWYLLRGFVSFRKLQMTWWPKLFKFGAPLVPDAIAMYIMFTADRWIIQYYLGEAALGIYAVGSKFAMLMMLAIQPFRTAWWPVLADAMFSDDGPELFRTTSRLYMGLGIAVIVYATFLSPWIVDVMTTDIYTDAYLIFAILAWQAVFYGFFVIAGAGIRMAEKTYIFMIISGVAALLNIILNIIIIPMYGAIGTAIVTVTIFFVWVYTLLIIGEKYWPVKFPLKILLLQTCIGTGAVIWILVAYENNYSLSLIALLSHILALILLLSSVKIEQLKNISRVTKKYISSLRAIRN
jgi:O-antigen/teichoic acid export membrane protein